MRLSLRRPILFFFFFFGKVQGAIATRGAKEEEEVGRTLFGAAAVVTLMADGVTVQSDAALADDYLFC